MAILAQGRLPILMPQSSSSSSRTYHLTRVHCSKPHPPDLQTARPVLLKVKVKSPSPPPPPPPDQQLLVVTTNNNSNNKQKTDDELVSTWSQRAWVAGGCSSVLISLARSTSGGHWVEPILGGLMGYLLADLGSGVYHWAIDNYGGADTPVFGDQIDAFQGHHKRPWTITRRQFSNNIHALARAVTFVVLPINLLFCGDHPVLLGFVGVCSGCIMFSQQSHAWAHMTRSKLPVLVSKLQDCGLLVSPLQHAEHHRSPYNTNYCIVSGLWNYILDASSFFQAMEMVIFFRFRVRPRSWTDPNSDWTQEIQTISSSD